MAAEFHSPAVLVGSTQHFRSCLWKSVTASRKTWLKNLQTDDEVFVIDDYGNVYQTSVRAVKTIERSTRSMEPRIWLNGHSACYAAARMYPDMKRILHG